MKELRIFCGTCIVLWVCCGQAKAQFLYGTAGKANLQTATLENIMLLQNVRDVDYACPDCQTWFTGYGFGGFADGMAIGSSDPGGTSFVDPNFVDTGTTSTYPTRYSQAAGGFLLGADKNLTDSCRAGLFFSWNNNVIEDTVTTSFLQRTQRINMHNYFWGGYGRKDFQRYYLLGSLAGGYSRLGETITYLPANLIPDSGMKTSSWRALAYGEVGKEFRVGRSLFQPFWGVQYFYNGYGASQFFDETQPLSQFDAVETNSLRNILGLRYARDLLHSTKGFLKFDCIGFWYHEFLSNEDMGVAKITGSVSQQATAVYTGRDWAVIAPTLTFKSNNLRLWAGYIVMFNESETINLGQGGVALCF